MENCPRGAAGRGGACPARPAARLGALPAGGLGCRPLVARVAPGRGLFCYSFWGAARRWRVWPRVGRGLFCYSFWGAVRWWRVWPRVGRGLFCYSFWDAASTSAI